MWVCWLVWAADRVLIPLFPHLLYGETHNLTLWPTNQFKLDFNVVFLQKSTAVTLLNFPVCYVYRCILCMNFTPWSSLTPGCVVPATGQWISLIKCCLPHMCLMNKDTSLLSGTQLLPHFPSSWSQKIVWYQHHKWIISVKYVMLIKKINFILKSWIRIEIWSRVCCGWMWIRVRKRRVL